MAMSQIQANLFKESQTSEITVFDDAGLDAQYHPNFISETLAQSWFEQLLTQTVWQQGTVTVYGKQHLTPRLSCWMGESWMSYRYSQHTMQPTPWQALPLLIKEAVETELHARLNHGKQPNQTAQTEKINIEGGNTEAANQSAHLLEPRLTFNSVLINYYRDGQDSNGWHADDETELGQQPVIASLSLGAPRDFHLREKTNHANKHKLKLGSGSLLIMRGDTQAKWQHQVPKRATAEARINLTFRTILKHSVVLK